MDEYLFILAARLKADRLKLAREARAALHLPSPSEQPTEYNSRRVEPRRVTRGAQLKLKEQS